MRSKNSEAGGGNGRQAPRAHRALGVLLVLSMLMTAVPLMAPSASAYTGNVICTLSNYQGPLDQGSQRQVMVANNGTWYVQFCDGSNDQLYYSSDGGASWASAASALAGDRGYKDSVWHSDGILYSVITAGNDQDTNFYVGTIDDASHTVTWSDATALPRTRTYNDNPMVILDSNGLPWITRTSTDDSVNNSLEVYRGNAAGTAWSNMNIDEDNYSSLFSCAYSVGGGKMAVVWSDLASSALFAKVWDGSAWGARVQLNNGPIDDCRYWSVVSFGGHAYVAWSEGGSLELREFYGSLWSPAETLEGPSPSGIQLSMFRSTPVVYWINGTSIYSSVRLAADSFTAPRAVVTEAWAISQISVSPSARPEGVIGVAYDSVSAMQVKFYADTPVIEAEPAPLITTSPVHQAYMGEDYEYTAECTPADSGSVTWDVDTDAEWLDWAPRGGTCTLSGAPPGQGTYHVRIRAADGDSQDWQNYTLTVLPPYAGGIETFDSFSNGTLASSITLSTGTLKVLSPSADTEIAALNGRLISFTRASMRASKVLSFTPNLPGRSWTISSEIYPAKDYDMHHAEGASPAPTSIMYVDLESNGAAVARTALRVGEPGNGYENVRLYSAANSTWWTVLHNILPGKAHRHDPSYNDVQSQDGIYGDKVDCYLVEYRYSGGTSIVVRIYHSLAGALSLLSQQTIALNATMGTVTMSYSAEAAVYQYGGFNIVNAWFIDNLRVTGTSARYAVVNPTYEYVFENSPAYVVINGVDNAPITDAAVSIGGVPAAYIPARQRYEANLGLVVDWAKRVPYTVTVDGCTFGDVMRVTTMSRTDHGISLPLWWNGWDWVSVFGEDDVPLSTAISTYSAYRHPVTAYEITPANADIWAYHAEAASHYPHNYATDRYRFWSEAMSDANQAQNSLARIHAYASIWDDPSYVGKGDTYIMRACPGNGASWDTLYAMYEAGFRVMGRDSDILSAVTTGILAAWWDPRNVDTMYPYDPMQLMNIDRAPDVEYDVSGQWSWLLAMAAGGGVVSFYTHGAITTSGAAMLRWTDNAKTNSSYENWKATNGEVASYVNGRWTTDANYLPRLSGTNVYTYEVSRRSPYEAGYWNVPVTLAFDLTQITCGLGDILITEGSRTLRMSDGTLRDLHGARVMGVGYDVRGDTLYVSYFWNTTSRLSILGEGLELPGSWAPALTSAPFVSAIVGHPYSWTPQYNETVTLVPDSLPSWLRLSGGHLEGTPLDPGKCSVSLRAISAAGFGTYVLKYTIDVTKAPALNAPPPPPEATPGQYYSYQATADQDVDWGLTTNATWLHLDDHGRVYGIPPNLPASYWANLTAANPNGTGYLNWTIQVAGLSADEQHGRNPDMFGPAILMAILVMGMVLAVYGKSRRRKR